MALWGLDHAPRVAPLDDRGAGRPARSRHQDSVALSGDAGAGAARATVDSRNLPSAGDDVARHCPGDQPCPISPPALPLGPLLRQPTSSCCASRGRTSPSRRWLPRSRWPSGSVALPRSVSPDRQATVPAQSTPSSTRVAWRADARPRPGITGAFRIAGAGAFAGPRPGRLVPRIHRRLSMPDHDPWPIGRRAISGIRYGHRTDRQHSDQSGGASFLRRDVGRRRSRKFCRTGGPFSIPPQPARRHPALSPGARTPPRPIRRCPQ